MSRSFKKHPYVKDGGPEGRKFAKKLANKKVRRSANIGNGKAYRRVFEPYDIHDWTSYWPWPEAKDWYEKNKEDIYWLRKFPTLKSFYRHWKTSTIGK